MAVRYIKDGEERTRWGGGKRNEVNLYGGKGRRGEVVKTKKRRQGGRGLKERPPPNHTVYITRGSQQGTMRENTIRSYECTSANKIETNYYKHDVKCVEKSSLSYNW